ncbi:MAG: glycosyltransferase [Hyphomicrobiaceae bacterium]|nr:glycosyltransferase [Hyphomicrobiaceae bacterium]
MISVVIATHNDGASLAETLAALVPAALDGLVREVIVADGGSNDTTRPVADAFGAEILELGVCHRAACLNAGAHAARSAWVLFVPPTARLRSGFEREIAAFAEASPLPAAWLQVRGSNPAANAAAKLRCIIGGSFTERDCLLVRRSVVTKPSGGFQPMTGGSITGGRALLRIDGGAAMLAAVAQSAAEPILRHDWSWTRPWLWTRRGARPGTSVTQTSANERG